MSGELECPGCGRRATAAERFCDDCGLPLVLAGATGDEPAGSEAHARARKIRPELTRGRLVRVVTAHNQAEAELLQNMLLEEGVPSVTRRSAGFDVPDFLAAGPRDVLVPESGAETARSALSAASFTPALVRPPATDRAHVARVAAALVAGAGLAGLVAWALSHAVR